MEVFEAPRQTTGDHDTSQVVVPHPTAHDEWHHPALFASKVEVIHKGSQGAASAARLFVHTHHRSHKLAQLH